VFTSLEVVRQYVLVEIEEEGSGVRLGYAEEVAGDQAQTSAADLDQRGLLDETLVLVLSEHGRTPKISSAKGGGRDHWSQAYSAVLAGGGIGRGRVVGKTDKIAGTVVERPISPKDVLATVYHLLGIDPETLLYDRTNRPIPLVQNAAVIPGAARQFVQQPRGMSEQVQGLAASFLLAGVTPSRPMVSLTGARKTGRCADRGRNAALYATGFEAKCAVNCSTAACSNKSTGHRSHRSWNQRNIPWSHGPRVASRSSGATTRNQVSVN
jgi:hypothetical protein